jgi:hypothetical protein
LPTLSSARIGSSRSLVAYAPAPICRRNIGLSISARWSSESALFHISCASSASAILSVLLEYVAERSLGHHWDTNAAMP